LGSKAPTWGCRFGYRPEVMAPLGPITLEGHFVRLEPLAERHLGELAAAASDPGVWRWLPTRSYRRPDFEAWFAVALAPP
jgi:hypothetical protein